MDDTKASQNQQKSFFLHTPSGFWRILLSAASSFGFYAILLLVFHVVQPDLDEHIAISERMWLNGKVPAHPMFYALIQVLSFFTNDAKLELMAAFLIFGTAQMMKIIAACSFVETITDQKMSWLSFAAVFISCWMITPGIFEEKFIVNQMVPNFFHNGTLMVSIPFSIWMVQNMYRLATEEDFTRTGTIILAGILSGLGKPSLLFCVIPVFPVYVFLKKGISIQLLRALQISLLLSFLVIGQSLYLRINPPNYIGTFKIEFLPFYQYGTFWDHVKVLAYSLAIPVFLFITGKKELKKDFLFFLAGCHFFGLGIAFTLVDTINGMKFNNMTWQTSVTLLLMLISFSGTYFQSDKIGLKRKVVMLMGFAACLGYFGLYSFKVIIFRTFFL